MSIQGQWIDGYGKTRIVVVDGVYILISPTAILKNVKQVGILSTKISIVTSFCKTNNINIVAKEVVSEGGVNKLVGLWLELTPKTTQSILNLNSAYYYAIITPVDLSKVPSIKSVNVVDSNNNLNLQVDNYSTSSELLEIRKAKKIANILKKYALFLYSHYPEKDDEGKLVDFPTRLTVLNSEQKTSSLFTDEIIDSLPKKIDFDNEILTRDKMLILPSDEIKRKIIDYVSTYTLNYNPEDFRNIRLNVYNSLDDFEKHPDEIIVDDASILDKLAMLTQQKFNVISSTLNSELRLPYIISIGGRLCIIQNTPPSSKSDVAITIGIEWINNKINTGYNTKPDFAKINNFKGKIDIIKFDDISSKGIFSKDESSSLGENVYVISQKDENDKVIYSAVLSL
jgi:hypothetical protein